MGVGIETFIFQGSSNVESAEYDYASEDLTVTFTSGRRYLYRNVPAQTWRQFCLAPSAGKFLWARIRPVYMSEEL